MTPRVAVSPITSPLVLLGAVGRGIGHHRLCLSHQPSKMSILYDLGASRNPRVPCLVRRHPRRRPAPRTAATCSTQCPETFTVGSKGASFVKDLNRDARKRDQAAGQRDQLGDRRDEKGHQRDKAAGQRDEAAEQRDEVAGQRDEAAEQRDEVAEQRDHLGEQREEVAEQRDHLGLQRGHATEQESNQRDQAAGQRDQKGQQRGQAPEQRDQESQQRGHAAEQRDQEGLQRDEAAEQREEEGDHRDQAAELRERSAADAAGAAVTDALSLVSLTRTVAAVERVRASQDRRAAADERAQAGRDRAGAVEDRMAGASGRDDSELDRENSTGDRAASASYRGYATELATSLQLGWTVRQLDPPKLLFVSPGCLKILGLDPHGPNLTVATARAMIHPDDASRIHTEWWPRARAGRTAQAELRVVQPTGVIRWLRVTSNPVLAGDGTVMRAADTIEDITDAKTAEHARWAQGNAERANTAKTEFLSRMSHELRTPLNSVLGFGQLLELDDLSELQADAVGHIVAAGRYLLELIEDILDISRIETGHLKASLAAVEMPPLLADVVALMRPAAVAAGITIHSNPPAPDPFPLVHADQRRLRQVLLNLLSNAIKYNKPNGRIDITCQPAGRSHLQVTVSDTGLGIDTKYLSRLFTPFDRLHHQHSDIEGAGLGLALSQRLMSMMDGQIRVTSHLGQGSSFTITLPLAEPSPRQDTRSS